MMITRIDNNTKFNLLLKMRECLNKKGKYYSGKENTPLGRGYSASGEKIGTRMRGKNGGMYVVVKYQNGKRWQSIGDRNVSPRGNAPKVVLDELNEVLEKLRKSYSVTDTEKGPVYTINYSDGDDKSIEVKVGTLYGDEKTIKLDYIEIGEYFKGRGLCLPLVTYLFINAYNDMIVENDPDSIYGYVWLCSKYPENASRCYINSFEKIGFKLTNSFPGRMDDPELEGKTEIFFYFEKERPENGWKNLIDIYSYKASRTDIDYIITRAGIYAR